MKTTPQQEVFCLGLKNFINISMTIRLMTIRKNNSFNKNFNLFSFFLCSPLSHPGIHTPDTSGSEPPEVSRTS